MTAFPLLAVSLTDEPAAVAGVAAAAALPWIVTGLLAGSLADRRGARVLICVSDATRVIVLAGLLVAVTAGAATIALVAITAFLLGVGETIRDTASQTVIPRLVPIRLIERANGRLIAAEVTANEFVGPLVGASLFAVGAALPFAANSAVLSLAVLLVLSIPGSAFTARTGVSTMTTSGVRVGVSWLLRHRLLRALAATGAGIAFADSAWFAIFVLFSRDRLDLGPVGFGALLATGAAGGLAGAVFADRAVRGHRHRAVLGWSMAVTAGLPPLLLVAERLWAAVVVVVLTSAAFGMLNVAATSLRHRLVPPGLIGRITASWRVLTQGGAALGAVTGGLLATGAGLSAPFMLSGVIAVVATVGWWIASRPVPPASPAIA